MDKDTNGKYIYCVVPEKYKCIYEKLLIKLSDLGIDILKEDDILLILGKGHETYQIIKDKKIHFDDKEIVLSYLNMI